MTNDTLGSWVADHLRVTLFSSAIWSAASDEILNSVFGVSPESVTNRPMANEVSAVGTWEGKRLEIKRIVNRVDFILQATPSDNVPIAMIADLQHLLVRFATLIGAWGGSQPQSIVRVAVGVGAFLEVASVRESYVKLKELVRVIPIDVDRFREMRFQVNLPIASSVLPNLTINRLSNWASLVLRAGLVSPHNNSQFFDETKYCNCTLDINTDSDRTSDVDATNIEPLVTELANVALSILANGIE